MRSTGVNTPISPRPPHVRRAWIAVGLFPAVLVAGFVIGSLLVGDPNDPRSPHDWDGAWRVILLWAGIEVIPLLGIHWAMQARRLKEAGALNPLLVNALLFLLLTGTTLVGGLLDSFK